jgi:hypothetical protein
MVAGNKVSAATKIPKITRLSFFNPHRRLRIQLLERLGKGYAQNSQGIYYCHGNSLNL